MEVLNTFSDMGGGSVCGENPLRSIWAGSRGGGVHGERAAGGLPQACGLLPGLSGLC